MLEVILSKAIIIPSIVTQENVAVLTVPHRLVSLLLVVVAVVAASTILCSSDGIVCLAKATCCRGVARTTWSLSTGIAANQLLCQGYPEFLHGFIRQVGKDKYENCRLCASEKHSLSGWDQNQWQ